jgi:hypothetical protein
MVKLEKECIDVECPHSESGVSAESNGYFLRVNNIGFRRCYFKFSFSAISPYTRVLVPLNDTTA